VGRSAPDRAVEVRFEEDRLALHQVDAEQIDGAPDAFSDPRPDEGGAADERLGSGAGGTLEAVAIGDAEPALAPGGTE
jgi:hypothetical protein